VRVQFHAHNWTHVDILYPMGTYTRQEWWSLRLPTRLGLGKLASIERPWPTFQLLGVGVSRSHVRLGRLSCALIKSRIGDT
jgi:hypothetical protein